ncbi:MAG: DNA polymerase III subunit delta [Clostridiales bacterium]|jgi:DNA polymerase-3 subunit delta|nr:DNA polymerase III subunit delta [Clostridiales bacterium]
MKNLKADLKSGKFKGAYLFYGPEKYLSSMYEAIMREKLVPSDATAMNLDVFEGKDINPGRIIDAAETAPFLNEYRLVEVRDSKLFTSGRKVDSERMSEFLGDAPESTILLFIEGEADKRLKIFKKIAEVGRAVEFKPPTEKELLDWIINMFKKRGKSISLNNALFLLKRTCRAMEDMETEIEKAAAFAAAKSEISQSDIEAVCTPSLEARVFDLVDAVGGKNTEAALDIFSNMMLMKEQPIVVLAMISRQLRLILQSKALMEKGLSSNDIANYLKVRGFVASECLKQGRNYKKDELLNALADCLEADINIKTGKINDKIAIETLIVKFAS